MNVRGTAAIVTGGGTGVGRATAMALAKRGANVAINYSRSKTEAQATVGELTAFGIDAFAEQADVADDAACQAFVAHALERFGRLDILVNNAGTTTFVPHHRLDQLAGWGLGSNPGGQSQGAVSDDASCGRSAAPIGRRRGHHGLEHRGDTRHREFDSLLHE